ncbi:hypothetical protein L3X38_011960 [Prunus dulcis]|uniref:Uncharacterized protein n=1 Tax=Prunus dulcis TaxID=3755 RepID=A0AAD4WJ44_PRUDU|nr:hypothetical protein L3X38_011960 [Prunus dulcis]
MLPPLDPEAPKLEPTTSRSWRLHVLPLRPVYLRNLRQNFGASELGPGLVQIQLRWNVATLAFLGGSGRCWCLNKLSIAKNFLFLLFLLKLEGKWVMLLLLPCETKWAWRRNDSTTDEPPN